MFNKGDKIVYGQTGVCIVEDICEKVLSCNVKKIYYTLKPVYQRNNVIYAPVDSQKVFMRYVISSQEAHKLINLIPDLRKKVLDESNHLSDSADYKADFDSHSCINLLRLTMKLYAKKQMAHSHKKKIGFADERYMKKAEELLFGELAVALDIPVEQVPKTIFNNI